MGKYKKLFYFVIIVLSFTFLPNVNAEVISLKDEYASFGIDINGYTGLPQDWYVGPNTYRELDFTLYNYEGVSRPYTYVLFSICSQGYPSHWYLSNTSSKGYFNEQSFQAVDGVGSCLSYGIAYRPYFIQFQVAQYEDMDGTGEELMANTTLLLVNPNSGGYATYFPNMYLSSDDVISAMAQNQDVLDAFADLESGLSNLDTGIANVNSAIASTNSKLDATNDLLEDSNKKQQEIIDTQKETNEKLDANTDAVNEQTDTMKDSDSSEATDSAGSFFSGFTTDTFGLTSIITAPLNLITSITSSTCSPVGLPIPFVDNMTLNLPCLRGIYEQHFGTLLSVYQTITFGIVAYWVCIRIFALVKDFKNPEHDEIEVLDL